MTQRDEQDRNKTADVADALEGSAVGSDSLRATGVVAARLAASAQVEKAALEGLARGGVGGRAGAGCDVGLTAVRAAAGCAQAGVALTAAAPRSNGGSARLGKACAESSRRSSRRALATASRGAAAPSPASSSSSSSSSIENCTREGPHPKRVFSLESLSNLSLESLSRISLSNLSLESLSLSLSLRAAAAQRAQGTARLAHREGQRSYRIVSIERRPEALAWTSFWEASCVTGQRRRRTPAAPGTLTGRHGVLRRKKERFPLFPKECV